MVMPLAAAARDFVHYSPRHFTGAQTNIFIGNRWLADCSGLEYHESFPKYPVGGYADFEFRDIHCGSRIVNGVIVIKYTYPMYMAEVLAGVAGRSETSTIIRRIMEDSGLRNEMSSYVYSDSSGAQVSLDLQTYDDPFRPPWVDFSKTDGESDRVGFTFRPENTGRYIVTAEEDEEGERMAVYDRMAEMGERIMDVVVRQSIKMDIIKIHGDPTPFVVSDGTRAVNGEVIIDAHLTDRVSRVIADGDVVAVQYSFVARKVVPLRASGSPTT